MRLNQSPHGNQQGTRFQSSGASSVLSPTQGTCRSEPTAQRRMSADWAVDAPGKSKRSITTPDCGYTNCA